MIIRRDFLRSLEASVIGLFLIQSIRFLYGTLYAHVSSADLTGRVFDQSLLVNLPGYITPADSNRELFAVALALLSPLLALVFARLRWSIALSVSLAAVGRALALLQPDSAALAAALTVGAAVLYMALIIIHRPSHFPPMLLLGIAFDQLIRASYDSADPTWQPDFTFAALGFDWRIDTLFIGIAIGTVLLSGYVMMLDIETERIFFGTPQRRGLLTGWGSIALGGFFFIELTLLGLANAVARWARIEYEITVPLLLLATLAPLIPRLRAAAGEFIGAFIGFWRGWIWALLLGFWFVLGNRFEGILSLIVLLLAQLMVGLMLWYVIRNQRESDYANPTPVLMLLSMVIFGILSTGDYFTYDYAFVRDFVAPFGFLAEILRAMRGMGVFLFLTAALLLAMPMILERRVIPWEDGRPLETYVMITAILASSLFSFQIARAPSVIPPTDPNCLRVGTLNLHSGYTMLFAPNLHDVVDVVGEGNPDKGVYGLGLDIILLQEVDTGRMSSFGVDQVEWLARQLNMEAAFFPLNESMQGLAVLSRLPIRDVKGQLLTSNGAQAGILYIEVGLDEQPFHIYNVWLGFQQLDENGIPLPLEQQDQYIQDREVRNIILSNHIGTDFQERILLGGSFNYEPTTEMYRFWANDSGYFTDHFTGLFIENTDTVYLVDGTSARFDYLYATRDVIQHFGQNIDQENVVSNHRLMVLGIATNDLSLCRPAPAPAPSPQ